MGDDALEFSPNFSTSLRARWRKAKADTDFFPWKRRIAEVVGAPIIVGVATGDVVVAGLAVVAVVVAAPALELAGNFALAGRRLTRAEAARAWTVEREHGQATAVAERVPELQAKVAQLTGELEAQRTADTKEFAELREHVAQHKRLKALAQKLAKAKRNAEHALTGLPSQIRLARMYETDPEWRKLAKRVQGQCDVIATLLREEGAEFFVAGEAKQFEQVFDPDYPPTSPEEIMAALRKKIDQIEPVIKKLREDWLRRWDEA